MNNENITMTAVAKTVVEAAEKCGLLDSPVTIDPAFSEAEKKLIVLVLKKLRERSEDGRGELSPDEISSAFAFIFGKAAEWVTNFANHKEEDFDVLGLFDGHIPIYADDTLAEAFKASKFPVTAAQNFWDFMQDSKSMADVDPVLALAAALKWTFRFGCHFAVITLEAHNYRFI
ncbi:MAG: hypothetical protein MJ025_00210 [Victivallaceae bacterium]|nr:hypothetical protein [Victivallaceae bacterium]